MRRLQHWDPFVVLIVEKRLLAREFRLVRGCGDRERVLRKKRPVLKALTLGVREGGTPLIRLPEPDIVGNQGGRDWPKVVQL